jgi:hypothetical protein
MKKNPTVAFITTLSHNVGDDLVRDGISFLLEKAIGRFQPSLIHKHIPVTTRPEFEWVYTSGLTKVLDVLPRFRGNGLSKFIDLLPVRQSTDKVLNCELLVQAGAPVYWCFADGYGSHENEWFHPLIRKRLHRFQQGTPFLNIGAGTCQPFRSDGSEFHENSACLEYIRELHEAATLTTVRDRLAQSLLHDLGIPSQLIPCPSLFARDFHHVQPGPPAFVALNFMSLGGHYDLSQGIDSARWLTVFREFTGRVQHRTRCVMVCHSKAEERMAKRHFPGIPRFIGTSSADYLDFYSRAGVFVGSRLHGAYAVASFGRPAFVVGADTRTRMMDEIKLRYAFVNDVSPGQLLEVFDELEAYMGYGATIDDIRSVSLGRYLDSIRAALSERQHVTQR